MSELIELKWQQKGREVVIEAPKKNGEIINFLLEEKLINYLAGNIPRVYHFFIELNGETEKTYIVNFDNLKSVVSSANALKIRMSKNKDKDKFEGLTSKGKYCIARGESHHERHLNDKGWQHQRKYFEIYEASEAKTFLEIASNKQTNEQKQNKPPDNLANTHKIEASGSKLKACIKCNEIIPVKFDICPYCKADQNDDDTIDISI